MTFFHVLAVIDSEKPKMLFSDLSRHDLKEQFVTPYKRGMTLFAGSQIIDSATLKSVHIIETTDREDVTRQTISKASLRQIDEINNSGGVIFISAGTGYDPEDLLEGEADVTRDYLTIAPAAPAHMFGISKQALAWALGIIGAVLATGLAKWLG